MPKVLSDDLNARIVGEIARYPHGAAIDDLHVALFASASRRTLQRRLSDLVWQQKIARIGRGRGLRYRLPRIIEVGVAAPIQLTDRVSADVYVPISPEAEETRAYVRQPVQGRKPVGYDRDFLAKYQPGETRYLPLEIREHLHNIGRSPGGAWLRVPMRATFWGDC